MTTSEPTPNIRSGKVKRDATNITWWQQLGGWFLQRIWYVHPGYAMTVKIPPAICMRVLGTMSRPNMARLEHSNLFAHGRRYHLHHTRAGFGITTTTSVIWRYRARTSSIAAVLGHFEEEDATTTRVVLRGHILPMYLFMAVGIPTFFASMVVYMPWNIGWHILILLGLYGLSWIGHRFNAAIESYHMVHFVQKALEAYIPEPPAAMAAGGYRVINSDSRYDQSDFADAWDNFTEQMSKDEET